MMDSKQIATYRQMAEKPGTYTVTYPGVKTEFRQLVSVDPKDLQDLLDAAEWASKQSVSMLRVERDQLRANLRELQQGLAASRADNDRLLLRIKELDSEIKAGAHLAAKLTDEAREAEIEVFRLRQTIEALKGNAQIFDEVAAEADQKLREVEKKATPRPRGTDTIRAILVELNRQVEGMILDLAESQAREKRLRIAIQEANSRFQDWIKTPSFACEDYPYFCEAWEYVMEMLEVCE